MGKQIGRFEVLRELGRGAQSIVYLGRDPQLEREVAIKTLHFARADAQQNKQLLSEARMVSKLRHPNIVPIFEAGEQEGDLYLVFEYVPGKNLDDYLKANGKQTPVKAFAIINPILDAIAHAHAAGIIHRDLKPTNILLDEAGTARVMDFGISSHVESQTKDGDGYTGTPAYMAPEYIHNHVSSEGTDVFSAGLILYELLIGQRAIQGNDIFRMMNQIANEDISLPKNSGAMLEDKVVSVLLTALARDPKRRYASAKQMREAIDNCLEPEAGEAAADSKQSTIDFLLRRMRHQSDFPALSDSVSSINKITDSDKESISQLSNTLLKDFALTNKILRMVNSAFFRQAGGGNISTVSRAVLVLGFDAVRNIATTVLLFEHLQNKGNANNLKEEFLRANLAAILAKDIGNKTNARDVEQVFICAMFHNLGRLLSQYYFPEESEKIRQLVQQKAGSEEASAIQVLGVSFEELGSAIAQTWGFPKLIINSMRKLDPGAVRKPANPEERTRVLSAFSNELCKVIAEATPEFRQKELRKVTARFGDSVGISEKDLLVTMDKAFEEVGQFASIIQINLQQTSFGRQMKSWGGGAAIGAEEAQTQSTGGDTGLGDTVLSDNALAGASETQAGSQEEAGGADAGLGETILTAGIQDISNTLVEEFKLNDVLRIILETMYRAKGFKRVILCIRDARNNTMLGRFGFGPDAQDVAKRFNFSLAFSPDIFHAALSKGVDILISDTNDPKIATRIPEWFRKGISSETFLIFPLCIKGNPVAMIYADRDRAGEIIVSEKELSLLRTLRNQAVMAIKQAT